MELVHAPSPAPAPHTLARTDNPASAAFLSRERAMSVRPRQVAEEAHKFSLRNVFGTFDKDYTEEEPPPPAPIAAPVSPTAAPVHGLHFDLSLPSNKPIAAPPLLALPTNGLKFHLPQMRTTPQSENGGLPVRRTSEEAGGKMLRAGYIVGGAQGSQTEVMRLNGIVDDLQTKLKKCADRLATTEQSVARGNAALQSERATSHARMVALAGQVRDAQEREVSVRAEMASMPKVSEYDQQKFEMQAQGALQLEQKYEEEVSRAAALEEVLAGLRLEHETVKAEHTALQAELEASKAAVELVEATSTSVKREALSMVAEAEAKTDALLVEQAKVAEEVATAAKAGTAEIEVVKAALEEANTALQLSQASVDAEMTKGVEADMLIKSLDLKLSTLRDDLCKKEEQNLQLAETAMAATERAGEAILEAQEAKSALKAAAPAEPEPVAAPVAIPAVDDAVVNAFEDYYNLKRAAERAKGTEDAAHHHALAMRAYGALTSGTAYTPMVFSCFVDAQCEDDAEHVMSISAEARRALRDALPTTRSSGTHRDLDCPVELVTTGTPTTDTTPLALKMRPQAYVNAVSKDLRRGLMHASRQWITAAGGELPPLPPDLVLHGPEGKPMPDHPPDGRVPGQE